jgi:hypothetical protein
VNRRARWLLALVLATSATMPAQAATPKQDEAPAAMTETASLAGHYYLEGIMETGSELLLREDGRFQWYFTYGALDLAAEGRWQREGTHVVLRPDVFRRRRSIRKPNSGACSCASTARTWFPRGLGKTMSNGAATCPIDAGLNESA